MAADRFRQAEVLQVMDKADLAWPVEWRGQGWKDGSEDVRGAQKEIYEGRPNVLENLMLESAISESAIVRDPAGNPKLDRAHRRGRIDAIQAAVLAMAAGSDQRLKTIGKASHASSDADGREALQVEEVAEAAQENIA